MGQLKTLTERFSERDLFGKAQPLSVRLRGVRVATKQETMLRGGNDLMVVTKFQVGNEPPVERLQFMEKDTDLGWHDDFFNDVVLSTRDFTSERLTLRIQVYDVDSVDKGLVQSVQQFAQQAASVAEQTAIGFPQLSLYAGVVDFAVGPLVELVDNIDDHDRILDDRVTLEVAEPGTAHKLLQPGYVVCTEKPVESQASLRNDLRVRGADGKPYETGSYAVFELAREELADREFQISQRAAKLAAELKGKGQSGQPAITFLRDTLGTYSKFKKLQRARELQAKQSLTDAEQRLLDDLKSNEDLKPYLTDG